MPAPLTAPDPPLGDERAGVRLRRWRSADAGALAAAWADPAVADHCGVPPGTGVADARRWIEGWEERAGDGRALDLVVADPTTDAVLGEVGLSPFRVPGSGRVATDVYELGWWVDPAGRGRGLAATAVALVADWTLATVAPAHLVARIRPGHLASEAVATSAGFERRGRLDGHHDLWARMTPG